MKNIQTFRFLFIVVLIGFLIYWVQGGFEGLNSIGIINELIIGITIFFLLIVNCIAAIMHLKEESIYTFIANRMTITSVCIASLVFFIPYILQLAQDLKLN